MYMSTMKISSPGTRHPRPAPVTAQPREDILERAGYAVRSSMTMDAQERIGASWDPPSLLDAYADE